MRNIILLVTTILLSSRLSLYGQQFADAPKTHPDITSWDNLFEPDLSNSLFPDGVWTMENGVFTASKDEALWTSRIYDNFILDLEFKTADGTNSGVIVYATDLKEWIPNSVEIQIADDFAERWANSPRSWQCGAIFGHLPAKKSLVKKPGEWNRMTVYCQDKAISVILNGELITQMDMSLWTSATKNPDRSEIPEWLSTPFSELSTYGHIGFQGKHAGAPIYFRNMKIKVID
ncbi:MAG: DUF1080 domain-containing protein [Bacteroidetes bacterium]|nr:DUF1080 domain-containing protein [Bacteroidota bacterium]MDA1120802.1 DUF1080 domain-containing protein [Bacteroidota bacterium]